MIKRQTKEYNLLKFNSFEALTKDLIRFSSEGWVVIADMVNVPMYDNSHQNAILLERDFDEGKNAAEAAVAHVAVIGTKVQSIAEKREEAARNAKAAADALAAIQAEEKAVEDERLKAEADAAAKIAAANPEEKKEEA